MVSRGLGAVDWDVSQRSSPDALVHRMHCVLLVCALASKLAVALELLSSVLQVFDLSSTFIFESLANHLTRIYLVFVVAICNRARCVWFMFVLFALRSFANHSEPSLH